MIIWIDGVNGVGKSHVAAELEEFKSRLADEVFEKGISQCSKDQYGR